MRNIITFVCTANICRSPMAEKLLEHALKAEEGPLRRLGVISAGIYSRGGERASLNSIKVLKRVDIALEFHLSQPLTQELIDQSLAIFCMTRAHLLSIENQFKKTTPHIYLMRHFMPDSADKEIADPYGLDLKYYENTRDNMVEAIPSILRFLREIYSESH